MGFLFAMIAGFIYAILAYGYAKNGNIPLTIFWSSMTIAMGILALINKIV